MTSGDFVREASLIDDNLASSSIGQRFPHCLACIKTKAQKRVAIYSLLIIQLKLTLIRHDTVDACFFSFHYCNFLLCATVNMHHKFHPLFTHSKQSSKFFFSIARPNSILFLLCTNTVLNLKSLIKLIQYYSLFGLSSPSRCYVIILME